MRDARMNPVAEGVMAATQKLVEQAMSGDWQAVPKTIEARRALLEQLAASSSPQDREWLNALRSAMAESDQAVARIAAAPPAETAAVAPPPDTATAAPPSTLEWLSRR